jgi:hypothetical protein
LSARPAALDPPIQPNFKAFVGLAGKIDRRPVDGQRAGRGPGELARIFCAANRPNAR